jgi:hypothetical protein
MSPLSTILLPPALLEETTPHLESTISALPTLLPSSRPPQSIHTLLAETAELIQDLNYLKDTLQVNQQATQSGGRKLRAVKDVVREAREEMTRREESIRWLEDGGWDVKLKERRVRGECDLILGGFEKVCEGWGARILGQESGIGVAM